MIRGSSENSSFIASLSLDTSSKLSWHLQIFVIKGNIFGNLNLIKLNHVNLICEGKNQDSTVCIGQGQFCHGRELLVLKVDLNDVNSSPKVKCWSYNVLHWPGSCWEGPGKIGRLCPRCWDWWLCCSGEECDDLPSSRYPGLWISQDSFPSPSIWNEIQKMYKRVGLELLKIVTKSGEIIKRSTLHTLQVRMFCLCSFHLNIIEVLPTPAGPRNTTLERV